MRFLRKLAQPFLDPRGALESLVGLGTPKVPELPDVPASVTAAEAKVTGPMQSAADPARKIRMGRRALRIDPADAAGTTASGTRSGLAIPGM